jgi:hypothetical protein
MVEAEVCLAHGESPLYGTVTAENAKQGALPLKAFQWLGFRNQNRAHFKFINQKVIQSRREGTVAGDICISVGFEALTTVLPRWKSYGMFRRVGWSSAADVSKGRSVTVFSVKQSKMKAIRPSETSAITSPVDKE